MPTSSTRSPRESRARHLGAHRRRSSYRCRGRDQRRLTRRAALRGAPGPTDDDERARRVDRLAAVEANFDPLPVTAEVARFWGRLAAAVHHRGGKPRRRQTDLAIAATARVEDVPLLTHNIADFQIINDLVDARRPSD